MVAQDVLDNIRETVDRLDTLYTYHPDVNTPLSVANLSRLAAALDEHRIKLEVLVHDGTT